MSARFNSIAGRRGGDLVFAALIMSIIGLLIVPLPAFFLDLLLTANIALAVVLLLSAIYVTTPLKLSTFPSLLLVATLFRLALNVSSTRLILGKGSAGQVIESFGEFVVQGNYVVGAVIYLILTLIQFLVVAKGSERVAEVAARFTLDAMPGKQMAIDADLRAGAFSLDEARRKREELGRESQFFGSMDGAMKFVKGDAVAGMIITLINVCGGLIIGTAQRGMELGEAASLYTLLTVGDGLVSQIPALLISICSGIIVTRVGAPEDERTDLGTEIISQLSGDERVFGVAAVLLVALALVPGLPFAPFMVLALAAAVVAMSIRRTNTEKAQQEAEELAMDLGPRKRSDPLMVPAVTPILVEVPRGLAIVLKQAASEDELRDEVRVGREAFFRSTGVRLPQLKFRFGVHDVPPDHVRVRIYEAHEQLFPVRPDFDVYLAPPMELRKHAEHIAPWLEPVSLRSGSSAPKGARATLEAAGFRRVSLGQQILMGACAFAQRHVTAFVGVAEVQHALTQLEASHGALIEAVTPRPLSVAALAGLCRRLAEEGASIRDLRGILEAVAEDVTVEMDRIELLEVVRCGIARSIWSDLACDGLISGYMVAGAIDEMIRSGIRRGPQGNSLALPPQITDEIFAAFEPALARTHVFLCTQDVRRYLRQLLRTRRKDVVVLGFGEMFDGVEFDVLGTVSIGRAPL